jgi:hypothetical protein
MLTMEYRLLPARSRWGAMRLQQVCRWALVVSASWPHGIASGAPAPETEPGGKKQVVAAGKNYGAGPFWSFLFGKGYRKLWTTPISVPVLDLDRFAGGLEPVKAAGRHQTHGLVFKAKNGREYKFRSVDKDPKLALPKELRGAQIESIAQDQTSAGHPAAALVMEPLSRAAGLVHVTAWRLVVLPDSPRLGEFRKEFAGMLGMIEDKPEDDNPSETPGFQNLARIVDSVELHKIIRASAAERVDARAYLRARLVDFYVGDWDRHQAQWDWGKDVTDGRWTPIPNDRDQAFSRYNGALIALARKFGVPLGVFRRKYGDVIISNWVARDMDRRFFAELSEDVWDAEARDLAHRFTDEVIDAAVRRLPPEYYKISGAELAAVLKSRRDQLPVVAQRWYRAHARDVDVFASDDAERLEALRTADGLELRVSVKGAAPYFVRRFKPGETHEVRVYLEGGDDEAIVRGQGPVKLRVIGGAGNDRLDDSQGGDTRFYDAQGENEILRGRGTRVGTKPVTEVNVPEEDRPRDWGRRYSTPPWINAGADIGLFVGVGMRREGYGFGRDPLTSRQTLRAGYSTTLRDGRVEYTGEFRRVQSGTRIEVYARASRIEIPRFYGFGNDTSNVAPDDFFKAGENQYLLAPTLSLAALGGRFRVGPKVRYSSTTLEPTLFIGQLRPYGSGDFGEVGVQSSLEWDTRDHSVAPRKGVVALLGGSVIPPVWSVERTFGEVHGQSRVFVTPPLPLRPTLSARIGGKKVFGDYPFQESAFIGGARQDFTVRGLRGQRYAGDAAAYGNLELRLRLFRAPLIVPTQVGVFALADAGRVFLEGETSRRWHHGLGGGIWVAPVHPRNTLSLSAARSEGRTAIYLNAGLAF